MASELTLVQSQHIRDLGEIDPDHVVTPGIFVDRVLHVPYGDPSGSSGLRSTVVRRSIFVRMGSC